MLFLGGLISGALSSFCSAACSLAGGLIGSLSTGIVSALSLAGPLVSIAIGLVKGIADILGIGEKEEKPEELGLKAVKADKKLEDFDSFEEYKSYLDKINLSKEDLAELDNPTKKFVYKSIGIGVYIKGINEHYGMEIPISTYIKMADLGINSSKEAKTVLDTYKDKNINPDIEKAVNSELGLSEAKQIVGTLKEGIAKLENGDNILAKLDKMLEEI